MDDERDGRFPRWVYGSGTDPDARFSLANERTFLAWIRTSLALLAAGVALEALELPVQADLRFAAALLLVAVGVLAPVLAWIGWARAERAVRLGRSLPTPSAFSLLVVGVCVSGTLVLIGLAVA
ncbi:YidH family protein [Cellulomonas sp. ICMP 17802]|uniref:YidH family protein n=1 Tax=Cellulomonas sp. ICMP 17802 TaxID=3239199 RepID=UPI00351ADDAD